MNARTIAAAAMTAAALTGANVAGRTHRRSRAVHANVHHN